MLTAFHLVWCALLWLLAHPDKIGIRRVAALALVVGALPRVVIALARLPSAWMSNGWSAGELIAFESLTVLWLVFLTMQARGRSGSANKFAFPMMVFATVECIGAMAAMASVMSGLVQGVVASSWWRAVAAVVYGVAQVWYLRDLTRQSLHPEPHWNQL